MRFSDDLLQELKQHNNRMRPYFEQQRREAVAYLARGGVVRDSKLQPIADGVGCSVQDLRNAAAAQKAPKRRQDSRPVKSPIDTRQAAAARLRLTEARQRFAAAEVAHAELMSNPPQASNWLVSGIVATEYRAAKHHAEADLIVSKAMATAVAESVRRLGG
jgi:hypothetical protein